MNTEVIATELLAALDGNTTIEEITGRDAGFDTDAAYRVSAEILRRRRARGEKPIGRKVGFTNRTIWPEYGVCSPIWACVYDSTVTCLDEPAGSLAIGHLSQPRFEPIQAGELVTTGTLTSPSPIHGGETWTTELSGIELPGLHLRLE